MRLSVRHTLKCCLFVDTFGADDLRCEERERAQLPASQALVTRPVCIYYILSSHSRKSCWDLEKKLLRPRNRRADRATHSPDKSRPRASAPRQPPLTRQHPKRPHQSTAPIAHSRTPLSPHFIKYSSMENRTPKNHPQRHNPLTPHLQNKGAYKLRVYTHLATHLCPPCHHGRSLQLQRLPS